MSTIKNRIRLALVGQQLTCAQVAEATGLTIGQVTESIKHLRETGVVCTIRSGPRALYGLAADARGHAPNVSMVQHALSRSAVSVFQLGARA